MPGVNEGLGAGEKCGYKKANMRDLCGDGNVLYIECVNDNILVMIFDCTFVRSYHWNWVKGVQNFSALFLTTTCKYTSVWMLSSLQSRPTLCDPMDSSPPVSSVHGILQVRILEWAAMLSSRGSSWPRDWTHVSYVSCTDRQVLHHQCQLGKYPKLKLSVKKREVMS